MSISLAADMDALAAKAAGIAQNVYAWPAETVAIPCVVIGYPDPIEFDTTYGRGSDTATYPVHYLCGRVADKDARAHLSAAITGATAIKDKLDGPLTSGPDVGTVRVKDCIIQAVSVGAVEYLSATFMVEVVK